MSFRPAERLEVPAHRRPYVLALGTHPAPQPEARRHPVVRGSSIRARHEPVGGRRQREGDRWAVLDRALDDGLPWRQDGHRWPGEGLRDAPVQSARHPGRRGGSPERPELRSEAVVVMQAAQHTPEGDRAISVAAPCQRRSTQMAVSPMLAGRRVLARDNGRRDVQQIGQRGPVCAKMPNACQTRRIRENMRSSVLNGHPWVARIGQRVRLGRLLDGTRARSEPLSRLWAVGRRLGFLRTVFSVRLRPVDPVRSNIRL